MKNTYIKTVALTLVLCVSGLSSCLENDIPYPRIDLEFISIEAEGQTASASINTQDRIVTLTLGEDVDLANVKIKNYSITENAEISADITGGIDLTAPYKVVLSLYYDYEWTIKAEQVIERYFTLPGQVGASAIDPVGKRVVAYIPGNMDITAVQVDAVKLGPSYISKMEPDLNGVAYDFSAPVEVKVSYRDEVETWTIYVEQTEVLVSLDEINPWTNVMWVYGTAQEGRENGFEYRRQGDEDWIRLAQSDVISSGGTFKARIIHLDANTSYEVRAFSDANYSPVQTVMTEGYVELPNMSFDEWWLDGKIWCPWAEDGESFWDTGNKGATTLGDSNSVPSSDTWNGGSGQSAKLESKFVGIGGILGKLAAGNIFAGSYVRTDGTNGVLSFGREFNGHPTRLKGYWKYTSTPISHSSSEFTHLIGQPDTAIVYAALVNLQSPLEIRTNPSNRQLLDKHADYVIAYGEVTSGESIAGWTEFDLEFEYYRTNETPTYLIMVSTSSKYGDYFTGGDGSILWLDDFSLGWDY